MTAVYPADGDKPKTEKKGQAIHRQYSDFQIKSFLIIIKYGQRGIWHGGRYERKKSQKKKTDGNVKGRRLSSKMGSGGSL